MRGSRGALTRISAYTSAAVFRPAAVPRPAVLLVPVPALACVPVLHACSFADLVAVYRKKETDTQSFSGIIKSINLLLVFALPPIIALLIFGALSVESDLDGVMAFTTLSLFNTLRLPLVILPKCIRAAAEAASAIVRVEGFLLVADRKPPLKQETVGISIKAASFTYGSLEKKLLANLTIEITPGQLVMVESHVSRSLGWTARRVSLHVLPCSPLPASCAARCMRQPRLCT